MKFKACMHLNHEGPIANGKLSTIETKSGTVVFWQMEPPYGPSPAYVQFCRKHGRLNTPEACTSRSRRFCEDYSSEQRVIPDDLLESA